MAGVCSKDAPLCTDAAFTSNIKVVPLSLTSGNHKATSEKTWPGQFLTAGVRFTRIPFGRQDRVFAVRSISQGPFAFELDEGESAAFRLWEKTFVFSRDAKR